MRILVLPLDSRPCNTQFIDHMMRPAGITCVFPREEEMDDFSRPATLDASLNFLYRELPSCDAAVLSLEHLVFGSLLASREKDISTSEAMRRVQLLRELLLKYPSLPVYLCSVLMRSSISTLTSADLEAHHAMHAYSVAADRLDRYGLEKDRAEMEAARKRIPDEVLDTFLNARRRNLQVNLAAVDLAAEGLARSVCILQEDCQPYGLPRREQREILRRMEALKTKNVFLRNGTDEGCALLAAMAASDGRESLAVRTVWMGQKDFTAPYEDRPFLENWQNALLETGVREAEESETVFCVVCPEHGEKEESSVPVHQAYAEKCASEIDGLIAEGNHVYLLDLNRANGGCVQMMRAMTRAGELWGYSAWNTASNAMGTLLAQAMADAITRQRNIAFLHERFLDDLLYEGALRAKLNDRLREAGEDIYCLSDRPRAEEILRLLYAEEGAALWPGKDFPACRLTLPWNRTFEVRASCMDLDSFS